MKIKRITEEIFNVDYEKELERLQDNFTGDQLKRQTDLLDAIFIENDLDKMWKLYDALPYSAEDGCSECEFIGLWMSIFTGGFCEYTHLKERERKFSFSSDNT